MQAHSSIKKACMVAGTPHCRLIPARPELDYALDPDDLTAAIEADLAAGLIPFYLVGTIGTTSSCAVDPIAKLGPIARKHNMWQDPLSIQMLLPTLEEVHSGCMMEV